MELDAYHGTLSHAAQKNSGIPERYISLETVKWTPPAEADCMYVSLQWLSMVKTFRGMVAQHIPFPDLF